MIEIGVGMAIAGCTNRGLGFSAVVGFFARSHVFSPYSLFLSTPTSPG